MIWNFIHPQLNQNTQNTTTQQHRTSQSSTNDSTTGAEPIDNTPHEQLHESQGTNTMHQCTIHSGHNCQEQHNPSQEHRNPQQASLTTANVGWGDLTQFHNPQQHFWISSKNVSTLNPQSLDMVAIVTELQSMQASVFLAQETNTTWTPTALNALQNQCCMVYHQHKLVVASSAKKHRMVPAWWNLYNCTRPLGQPCNWMGYQRPPWPMVLPGNGRPTRKMCHHCFSLSSL